LKKTITTILLLIGLCNYISAQAVLENNKSQVYPYLSRMAQKGLIEFDDLIQPINRNVISKLLNELNTKDSLLSKTEKIELAFYQQEYLSTNYNNSKETISFLKKDNNTRWRTVNIISKNFEFHADPLIGASSMNGKDLSILQTSSGFELWGTAGEKKQWGYQIYYRDYTETGTVNNDYRIESPLTSQIKVGLNTDKKTNYSEVRANISYSWKNGFLSFGKDNFQWGYGENGKIILSEKAPSYPYFRFNYAPVKWLSFNYMHAWLNSNLVDSNLSYNTYTGRVTNDARIIYIPKYLATHSIQINVMPGLKIAVGESVVYSDKLDPGFLLPINLFKFYDNNRSNYLINAGSNGQYFLQVNSRNQIKNTHLYASTFIDEIRVSEILSKKNNRNQLGFTIGGSVTDMLLPYLTLGSEYTRVNPFVYNNLVPAQTYKQYNASLGDWMGSNFDRIIFFAKYTPIPKLKLHARYQKIRKGAEGSIFQQYAVHPMPSFLFDFQKNRSDVFFQMNYEIINNLYVSANAEWISTKFSNGANSKNTNFQCSISFGL
jgi:hypothetical protein